MPIHSGATFLTEYLDYRTVLYVSLAITASFSVKQWAGGRKNTWEREWGGALIIVAAEPTPLTVSLLHHLSHLPHPPQLLYLPPHPSPLPQSLLTILHAIRLSASSPTPNQPKRAPAQLNCEPLPRTAEAVREFARKWGTRPAGTGEGGRRVDAVIWGYEETWGASGPLRVFRTKAASSSTAVWEKLEAEKEKASSKGKKGKGKGKPSVTFSDPDPSPQPLWTPAQAQFHLLTSLLPSLLSAPPERSIRLITLISPFYPAGMPSLLTPPEVVEEGVTRTPKYADAITWAKEQDESPILRSGKKGLKNLLLWKHLQRVLDALASAAEEERGKARGVPTGEEGESELRRRKAEEKGKTIHLQSNILAIPVVLGLDRNGVVGRLFGVGVERGNWLGLLLYILLYPLLYLLSPSPTQSVQSILHALSAPVRYEPRLPAGVASAGAVSSDATPGAKEKDPVDELKERRGNVGGGELVRDCCVIDLAIPESKIHELGQQMWEELEKEVEQGVKSCIEMEKKRGPAPVPAPAPAPTGEEAKDESDQDSWEKLEGDEDEDEEGEEGVKGVY